MDTATLARPGKPARRRRTATARSAAGHGATVRTRKQVRALVAPARQEVVDVLDAAGPCSVSTLAGLVGRPADGLYHHLRALVRAGLVTEIERRKEGRHVFAMYDLAVRPLQMSYAEPVRRADVAKVVGAAQRLAWRDFKRALATSDGVDEGPQRTLWGGRAKGWADPKRLAEINGLIAELMETVRAGAPRPGAVPISIGFLLSPAPVPRHARDRALEGGGATARTSRRDTANDRVSKGRRKEKQ